MELMFETWNIWGSLRKKLADSNRIIEVSPRCRPDLVEYRRSNGTTLVLSQQIIISASGIKCRRSARCTLLHHDEMMTFRIVKNQLIRFVRNWRTNLKQRVRIMGINRIGIPREVGMSFTLAAVQINKPFLKI
jgi:hypothetical protein